MYPASERQYTTVGGVIQVPWGGVYEWRMEQLGDWYTDS